MLTRFVDDGKGNLTPRPKNQDKKPKAFKFPPDYTMKINEPTKRKILWMLANQPYMFNSFFIADVTQGLTLEQVQNSKLNKYLLIVAELQRENFITYSIKTKKFTVTWKGKLNRLATHPNFVIIGLSFTVFSIIIIPLSRQVYGLFQKSENPIRLPDSLHYTAPQTEPLKGKDSAFLQNGKNNKK